MGSLPPYVERPPHPDQNPERTQNRISSVSVHVSTLFKQSPYSIFFLSQRQATATRIFNCCTAKWPQGGAVLL